MIIGTTNSSDGFTSEYRVVSIRKDARLQNICGRKSGYCVVIRRIERPIDTKIHLGDYGYHWNAKRSVCILIAEQYIADNGMPLPLRCK